MRLINNAVDALRDMKAVQDVETKPVNLETHQKGSMMMELKPEQEYDNYPNMKKYKECIPVENSKKRI